MRTAHLAAALLALGLTAGSIGTAEARDGCGLGFHRGFYGYCRPNLGPRFYGGYGYGPRFYGYRRWGWGGGWGYRRFGWHRWGGYRHVGWHGGWHGGWRHRW